MEELKVVQIEDYDSILKFKKKRKKKKNGENGAQWH